MITKNVRRSAPSSLTSLPGKRPLTVKQKLFTAEYLTDLNATKAAERAGYSKKTAKAQGARLLTNVDISAEIARVQEKRFQRLGITDDAVLQELAKIAFANMMDYITVDPNGATCVDLSRLTRDQAAAISEITIDKSVERIGTASGGRGAFERIRRVKFRLHDKLAALETLGRHLKLFTDKVEVKSALKVEMQDVKQKLLAKLGVRAA
jgi:phage terminase small subunit